MMQFMDSMSLLVFSIEPDLPGNDFMPNDFSERYLWNLDGHRAY